MPEFNPANLHIDTFGTSYLQAFRPMGMIAPDIFPIINVNKQTNVFGKIEKAGWFAIPNTQRAPGSAPREIRFTVSSDTYFAVNYALSTVIDFETIDNADDPWAPQQDALENLKDAMSLDFEARVRSKIASGCGSSATLTGGNAWNSFLTSDPLTNIETGRNAIRSTTGVTPNVAICPDKTWLSVRRHPEIVRAIFPGAGVGGVASPQQFADLIGVDRVLIPQTIKNTTAENVGNIGTFSDVWSTDFSLLYVNPRPGLRTATFGIAFNWKGPNIGGGVPGNWTVREMRDEQRGVIQKSTAYYQDEKITAAELGFNIATGIV